MVVCVCLFLCLFFVPKLKTIHLLRTPWDSLSTSPTQNNKQKGRKVVWDTNFTKATIPNSVNITYPCHGRYVFYYNNRTHPPYPEGYFDYAINVLSEEYVFESVLRQIKIRQYSCCILYSITIEVSNCRLDSMVHGQSSEEIR